MQLRPVAVPGHLLRVAQHRSRFAERRERCQVNLRHRDSCFERGRFADEAPARVDDARFPAEGERPLHPDVVGESPEAGGLNGARTQMVRFYNQRCTIVCLANLTSFEPETMIRRVADLYLADQLAPVTEEHKLEERLPTPEDVSVVDATALDLSVYAGRYQSEELDVSYLLRVQDGHLVLAYSDQPPIPLRPTAIDQFQDEGERTLRFTRDAAGAISGFGLSNGRVFDVRFVHARKG